MSKIYNISISNGFAEVLANRLLAEYAENPLELADVLLLLPNRRAAKAIADAFVQAQGMKPTLLPKMLPLGDVEEDELLLAGDAVDKALLELPPAIEKNERLLLFTKIIMAKPQDFGLEKMPLNQACFLAQELASLMDLVNNEQLSFASLAHLVPEEYAAHWQETLKFLEIITHYWPDILAERNLIDLSHRRNLLLLAQSRQWKEKPPAKRIIAAGTTATFPAMKELLQTVLSLPQGEVILAGLDKQLGDEAWTMVDETHPQFELKDLLDYLKIERSEVTELAEPQNLSRELLVSEVMRPAKTTDKWRDIQAKKIGIEALSGLSLIDCADIREEALVISLIMRETLEEPGRTAALVTADRNLARRVASELERWNLKVDDSAGKPLALTSVGVFLRLVAQVVSHDFEKVDFLSLLKHPLMVNGSDYALIRKQTRALEQKVWRSGKEDADLETFVMGIKESLRDFYEVMAAPKADFKSLIKTHIAAVEKLSATQTKTGEQILWRGEAGETAAKFVADLYDKADVLGEIETAEYQGLLEALMASVTVRPKFGTHPRLKILGPIEARLNRFDVTIIGGANEGIWPQATTSDPWMSRPMKKDFGFPLPEKAIGIMAQDFSSLLGGEEIYITRSERVQGTPMVKSRWWLRLETVLKALNVESSKVEDLLYRLIAKHLDEPKAFKKINPPAPKPPLSARPRELAASAIELWMRDPYSIFAKYILKLKPLDELNPDLSQADYGNIIHGILEEFNNQYPRDFPENAETELLTMGERYFTQNAVAMETKAFWWPNFVKTVHWLVNMEKSYRPEIKKLHNELRGNFVINAAGGDFVVTAKADRVDETKDGRVNIIDYKTGKARSAKEVAKGYAPQLPIEGLIARMGGFTELSAQEVAKLIYWQLAKKATVIEENMEELLDNNLLRIAELVHLFDFETTPYLCQPNPKKIPEYSDYEHLARVREWAVQEDNDEG